LITIFVERSLKTVVILCIVSSIKFYAKLIP